MYILLKINSLISSIKILNLFQTDAFYGTGTIALNDKLTVPLEDLNNDYDNQLSDLDIKKLEVCEQY